MDIKGKKLLVMGDNPESAILVETANSIGVKTIVTGVNKNTTPKKIAWKAFDINGLDIDAMEQLARKEDVDGIMVGVADILVPSYTELCDRLSFPCYSSVEAVKYLSNKSLFKEQLLKVGLPVIPEYQETEEVKNEHWDKLQYPIVVKPVDSGGGVGITIVKNAHDMELAIEKATKNSHSKRIQIEKYMSGDIIACYYTIIDGKVYLSSLEDNIFTKKQPQLCPVTTGHFYASRYLNEYYRIAHDKICKLLNNVNAKNGILQINAFIENGEFYFYDPGYRFQGEAQHHILNAVNGFDHKKMMVNFAFTGEMYDGNFEKINDPYLHGKKCASVWILLKKGIIGTLNGMDEISNDSRVVYNGQRLYKGMEVTDTMVGTEKQVLSRIYLVCKDEQELSYMINQIKRNIVIKDVDGNDMFLDTLNT